MKKLSTLKTMLAAALLAVGVGNVWADEQPTPVYFNDFSSTDGLTVVGNGIFEDDADARFGKVFHNDPTLTKAIRTNYLQLPADVLSHSTETKEMTIGFWVNVKNAADYWFTPIFTAYGAAPANNANTWPMFVCQSRGLLQVNCAGWCNFTAAQNDKAENYEGTFWLDDKAWHYYTATLTATKAVVYVDGEVLNSWTVSGEGDGNVVAGLFSNGADLKYICLGGNQAWDWNDLDPAYAFDDFAVYDKALTAEQIKAVIADKLAVPADATFDFTNESLHALGTKITDPAGYIYNEDYVVDNVELQLVSGSAPTRFYTDANRGACMTMYKEYATMTFRAPEGYAIQKITFTAAGNSSIDFDATSGAIDGMIWTGDAEGVRFLNKATPYLANAIVTLAAKGDATVALAPINYVECENIAAFNALENGIYAKVMLNDAELTGISADGESTMWIQDASAGCWIQYISLIKKYLQVNNKVNGFFYVVKRTASGNPQMKETEDTPESEFTQTPIGEPTIIEGTLAEVNVAANLNKVVKIKGATFKATAANKGVLTQGEASIDVANGTETANQQLHKVDFTADAEMNNVTIVAILTASSATKNQLLPISMVEEASGIETIHNSQFTVTNSIYNLQGIRLNGLQKGLNIVNGKKVVIK